MAVTKFFRVAAEGPTVDGRAITRDQIQQMADSYNPETYAARINCEHLRGFSPEGPFNAWGTIVALKAEPFDLDIGGKTEKRLGLYAQFDVTDQAKAYNEAGQKLFSSVEIQPEFAGTGKAYLVGCAVTDSPASLATQALKFSRDDKTKDHLAQVVEFELAFAEAGPGTDIATGVFTGLKKFFEGFAKPPVVEPVIAPVPAAGQADLPGFAAQLGAQLETFTATLTTNLNASMAALDARMTKLATDQAAVATKLEATKPNSYKARPTASGGNGRPRAEC